MKKVVLILIFSFAFHFNFANTNDPLLSQAKELSLSKNYTEAIKTYKKYLNATKNTNLKNVYVEIANCYFKLDDKLAAVSYIKDAIMSYGFSEQDFIYNDVIDSELSKHALSVVYDDLDVLHNKYVATLN